MGGGTLIAAGELDSLDITNSSTLDIGGEAAASLTTTFLSSLPSFSDNPLTVRFGLGATQQDLWRVSSFGGSFNSGVKAFLFDFHDLGDVATGRPYQLMMTSTPMSPSLFGFAPTATAAGWDGTFSSLGSSMQVTFVSTPEPHSAALLALASLLLSRRRRHSRK
jgi:MYXO-CTERM domain-containing protein